MSSGHTGATQASVRLDQSSGTAEEVWLDLDLLMSLSYRCRPQLCCQLQAIHCKAPCLPSAPYCLCKLHLGGHLDQEEIKAKSQ